MSFTANEMNKTRNLLLVTTKKGNPHKRGSKENVR